MVKNKKPDLKPGKEILRYSMESIGHKNHSLNISSENIP